MRFRFGVQIKREPSGVTTKALSVRTAEVLIELRETDANGFIERLSLVRWSGRLPIVVVGSQ